MLTPWNVIQVLFFMTGQVWNIKELGHLRNGYASATSRQFAVVRSNQGELNLTSFPNSHITYCTKVAANKQDPVNQHQIRKTKSTDIFSFVFHILSQVVRYYWNLHLRNVTKNSFTECLACKRFLVQKTNTCVAWSVGVTGWTCSWTGARVRSRPGSHRWLYLLLFWLRGCGGGVRGVEEGGGFYRSQ